MLQITPSALAKITAATVDAMPEGTLAQHPEDAFVQVLNVLEVLRFTFESDVVNGVFEGE
jgi:hypothetical protein